MTTKAVTVDEIQLATEMIASYLKDSAEALKNAKDVARQSGVPFKFDIEGLLVAFDPAIEEEKLKAEAQAQQDEDDNWCSSDDEDWDNSNC
jgi:hypothetical protein